jgi:hypothetical protein
MTAICTNTKCKVNAKLEKLDGKKCKTGDSSENFERKTIIF